MAVNAELLFNGVPGNYRTRDKVAIAISNNNFGDEYSWEYTLTHRPVGSAVSLVYTGPDTRELTPDVEGTYLVRLVVNGSVVAAGGMALEYHASGLREPAISETTEWDDDEGWAEALKNVFERINYGVGPRPAASYDVWGRIWHEPGGVGVADTIAICLKDAGDVYYWYDLTSGGGAAPLYSNSTPIEEAHGGVKIGDTFFSQTIQQMFDKILYPYLPPAFSAFSIMGQANPLEVGNSIPASVTFTWGTTNSSRVAVNSISIDDLTRSENIGSLLANSGSYPAILPSGIITKLSALSHIFQIAGLNTLGQVFSRNVTYDWRWRLFYGIHADASLTEAQVESLVGQMLTSTAARTYAFAAGASQYKYVVFPSSFAAPTVWKDQATNLDVPFVTVTTTLSIENAYLVSTNYTVQRSLNMLGAAMNIIVS